MSAPTGNTSESEEPEWKRKRRERIEKLNSGQPLEPSAATKPTATDMENEAGSESKAKTENVEVKKSYARGHGIQPNVFFTKKVAKGLRFKVYYTKDAGEGEFEVQVKGPDGLEIPTSKKELALEDNGFEVVYVPQGLGHHVVTVTFGGEPTSRSPFHVNVKELDLHHSKTNSQPGALEAKDKSEGKVKPGDKEAKEAKPSIILDPNPKVLKMVQNCTKPLVGVGLMTEVQVPEQRDKDYFFCHVCGCPQTPAKAVPHLYTRDHQMNYLKYFYPKYAADYQKLSRLKSPDEKRQMLQSYMTMVEKERGRLKMKIQTKDKFKTYRLPPKDDEGPQAKLSQQEDWVGYYTAPDKVTLTGKMMATAGCTVCKITFHVDQAENHFCGKKHSSNLMLLQTKDEDESAGPESKRSRQEELISDWVGYYTDKPKMNPAGKLQRAAGCSVCNLTFFLPQAKKHFTGEKHAQNLMSGRQMSMELPGQQVEPMSLLAVMKEAVHMLDFSRIRSREESEVGMQLSLQLAEAVRQFKNSVDPSAMMTMGRARDMERDNSGTMGGFHDDYGTGVAWVGGGSDHRNYNSNGIRRGGNRHPDEYRYRNYVDY